MLCFILDFLVIAGFFVIISLVLWYNFYIHPDDNTKYLVYADSAEDRDIRHLNVSTSSKMISTTEKTSITDQNHILYIHNNST